MNLAFSVNEAKAFFLTYDTGGVILDRVYSNARNATVQRGNVYRLGVTDTEKFEFWRAYEEYISSVLSCYKGRTVSDAEHLSVIDNFIKLANGKYPHVLYKGIFRFGSAQKLINLTLKYLWMFDIIDEPPHAPVDSYVSNNVGEKKYTWTKSNSKNAYLKVIKRCRRVSHAYGLSIAQWELLFWNMTLLSAKIGA